MLQLKNALCVKIGSTKGLDLAKGYGIDALCVDHKLFDTREAFEEKLYEVISRYEPDLIVLAGFMRILTAGFVDRFEGKILNIHPALLPSFKEPSMPVSAWRGPRFTL